MQLVYGFVPNDGSLDALIEKRANELATQIVMRTSNTMKLEDQGNTQNVLRRLLKKGLKKLKTKCLKFYGIRFGIH